MKLFSKTFIVIVCATLAALLPACAGTKNGFDLSNTTVPVEEIFSGGPPRDGIPAIDEPRFVTADRAAYLDDSHIVIGLKVNGDAHAYPLRILVWHEIANDVIGGKPVVVTFCPQRWRSSETLQEERLLLASQVCSTRAMCSCMTGRRKACGRSLRWSR